jgi:GNAT superfamily N-acetyltransferase
MNAHADLRKEIKILGSTEVAEETLLRFFKEMYPTRADLLCQHWRWLYRIDEFPDLPPPLVAVLGDDVIGHVAQIPVILRRGTREIVAAWGVDGGVLRKYRSFGIGTELMDIWYRQYAIGMGFCTEALYRILLKQGWTPRAATFALHLPLRPDRHTRFQRGLRALPVRLAGPVWNGLERLANTIRAHGRAPLREDILTPQRLQHWSFLRHPDGFQEPLHVARNIEFLTWRLLNCPFRDQYRMLETEDGSISAIVRTFQQKTMKRARIVSLSGETQQVEDIKRFLGDLISWSLRQRVDLLSMVSSDPTVIRSARWMFPIRSQLRFACICNTPEAKGMLQGTDHLWEMIDYDLDFLD